MDFLEVCREDIEKVNKMLIQIPRKIIDEKGPVWAADVSEVNYEKGEVGYLPPQYIVGFISNKDGSFVENPVPMEQRKKYKYHFRDGETKACDVPEKELI